jgi:hypothetical protein
LLPRLPRRARSATLLLTLIVAPLGCGPGADDSSGPPPLVPIQGKVTVDGVPLPTATVTFLPTGGQRTVTVGETDEEGIYTLRYLGSPGTAPGPYRVAISHKVTPAGLALGLAIQSSLSPRPEADGAKELLAPKYSDLGISELRAEVTPEGGDFDFDLEGPLLDPPTAEGSGSVDSEDPGPSTEEVPAPEASAPGGGSAAGDEAAEGEPTPAADTP